MTNDDLVQAIASPAETQCDQQRSELAKKAWAAAENILAELKDEPDAGVNYVAAVIYDLLRKETGSSTARIAELETALKPLVDPANEIGMGGWPDTHDVEVIVTAGDLRRARSALASPQREGDRPVSPPDGRLREPNQTTDGGEA